MFDAFSEAEKAALAAVIDKLLARTDHADAVATDQAPQVRQRRPRAADTACRPSPPWLAVYDQGHLRLQR
jgi:hypothetical protein